MYVDICCHGNLSLLGGNSFTTYSRVPFYFTSYTRSLFIESLDYAVIHFTKQDMVEIEINSTNLIGRIITGTHIIYLIIVIMV